MTTPTLEPSSGCSNYCQDYLPTSIIENLESGAFRSLCEHLRQRSDSVQNIDLMTVGGFCRNCLAKWMVVEARRLSDAEINVENATEIRRALDALGYDEAAQYVYGVDYGEWKQRHVKDASDEQMKRFNESLPIQATHDKKLLEPRGAKPSEPLVVSKSEKAHARDGNYKNVIESGSGPSVLSDVCCQDVEEVVLSGKVDKPVSQIPSVSVLSNSSRPVSTFQPPLPPPGGITFSLAVLTVSDRASANLYESGDLSGPAVIRSVEAVVEELNTTETPVACNIVAKSIVADDVSKIQEQLKEWCDRSSSTTERVDLVITTGGTGFAPRDVTPEATRSILDRECPGLLSFVTTECSTVQPLASLSRGTAGVRGSTFIANLPGNPQGVEQILPILLPIMIHAIDDLKKS